MDAEIRDVFFAGATQRMSGLSSDEEALAGGTHRLRSPEGIRMKKAACKLQTAEAFGRAEYYIEEKD